MNPDPSEIKRIGLRDFWVTGGDTYSRLVGTQEWVLETKKAEVEDWKPSLILSLVRQRQTPGEPKHWSLFVHLEGESGTVYQVKGDAACMRYGHANDINVFGSASFEDAFTLAHLTQEQANFIGACANDEPPPQQAINQASVEENCQGWTLRVLRHLVDQNIVSSEQYDMVKSLQEPI